MGNLPSPALRQPPPPLDRHHGNGGEKLRSEMAGENFFVYDKCRSRPYYLRRCKRIMRTSIQSLPDDIVFRILLKLPAQDIYDGARLVCRKWYHMIHSHNFIHTHLQHSTHGLLMQSREDYRTSPIFVVKSRGRIQISKFSYKFRDLIWTSCNGLLLVCDYKNRNLLIANPVTRQHFSLPPFREKILHNCRSGLAYVAASKEYKAVHTYSCMESARMHCAILTAGVDDIWRDVDTEHLSASARNLLCGEPLVTQGFVHWAGTSMEFLVTLNVETETLSQIPIPQGCLESVFYFCFPTDRYLYFITDCSKFCWMVWEMKSDTGEWKRLPDIDLEARKCTLQQLSPNGDCSITPVGWIRYKEVLLFRFSSRSRICIAYNVRTHEIEPFEIDSDRCDHEYVPHTNSLVWLGGC